MIEVFNWLRKLWAKRPVNYTYRELRVMQKAQLIDIAVSRGIPIDPYERRLNIVRQMADYFDKERICQNYQLHK